MKTNEVKYAIDALYSNKIDSEWSLAVFNYAIGYGETKTESMYQLIDTCSQHCKVALISKEKFNVSKSVSANVINFSDNMLLALQNLETVLELGNIEIGLLAIDDMYGENQKIYSELQKFSIRHDCYVVANAALHNTIAESVKSKSREVLNSVIIKNFTKKVPEYTVNLISGKPYTGKTTTLNSCINECNNVDGKVILLTRDVSRLTGSDNLIINKYDSVYPLADLKYIQIKIDNGFNLTLLAIDDFLIIRSEHVSELRKFAYKNKCNVIVTSTKHSDYFDYFINH